MSKKSNVAVVDKDEAKDLTQQSYQNARDAVQLAYANARNIAQTAYSSARDITQAAYGNARAVAQQTYETTRDTAQKTYGSAQGNIKSSFSDTQKQLGRKSNQTTKALRRGKKQLDKQIQQKQKNWAGLLGMILGLIAARAADTQKRLAKASKEAQRNIKDWQETSLQPGINKTQDVFYRGSERAQQNLQKAAWNARKFKQSVQEQYTIQQHKKERARRLFRIGIVTGILLALAYTPIAGADVRRKIMEQWNRYRVYVRF